ncbi:sulfurtransferase [Candidatus Nitrosacidococcus sp. I8]|uniref:sulfurtransferase n=1 Tax=Candidatus Nitrosacidococcus sp. I8 TaxID=2942908 RepID=UPI002228085F|nr:sulfurtransferase [Candidatus Nitrosacidococcus sp. I8]CAH9018210.1 Thiosulfate sulfurtransferase [Candidatus Nitrosacidococcus sp. I8]
MLLQPKELAQRLDDPNLLIVDLCGKESYLSGHIPGAVHLEYDEISVARLPAQGLMPEISQLNVSLSRIGYTPEKQVIAYDSVGNNQAARLLWVLSELGHDGALLLDGGLKAWLAENLPTENLESSITSSNFQGKYQGRAEVDKAYVLNHLNDPNTIFLDVRTLGEYQGTDARASRVGRIPGAVHFEWTQVLDKDHHLRFKPKKEIQAMLEALKVTPDKEIVCYCQKYLRASHTSMMLKYMLGYPKVKGYVASWSEWGNDPETPIEI